MCGTLGDKTKFGRFGDITTQVRKGDEFEGRWTINDLIEQICRNTRSHIRC